MGVPEELSKMLKEARQKANLTQRQLADRAGLHLNSYRYLERPPRTRHMSIPHLEWAFGALGLEMEVRLRSTRRD